MNKNTKGGKGYKKRAKKKKGKLDFHTSRVRKSTDEAEMYAKVTAVYGNGMAEVLCNDNVKRLLIVRQKFRGRNKRDNNVAIDKMLLVGRRTWQVVSEKKKQKVDLLYVYSESDINQLKNLEDINQEILPAHVKVENDDYNPFDMDSTNKINYDSFVNETKETNEINEMNHKKNMLPEVLKTETNKIDLDDFDFDDI
jgi:hypothetical protein